MVMFITFILLLFSIFFTDGIAFARTDTVTILIPLPDSCTEIRKKEKGKIYLEPSQNKVYCTMKLEVMPVDVEPGEDGEVKIYYRDRLWKTIRVGDNLEDYLNNVYSDVLERMREEASRSLENMGKGLSEETQKEINKRIADISSYISSNEFQDKIDRKRDEVAFLLLGSWYKDFKEGNYTASKLSSGNILSERERLYIFISSSVPSSVLRRYFESVSELRSHNVIFVLRGGVDGLTYLRPTFMWLYKIMLKDPSCDLTSVEKMCELLPVRVQIDPLLFRKYNITRVPAFVYVKDVEAVDYLSEGAPEISTGEHYISYGDGDFYYHLFLLGKESGKKEFIELASKKLIYLH